MSNPELTPRKKRLYTRIMIVFTVVLTLALAEIMVRILRPQPTYAFLLDMVGEYYAPSDFIPFTLKANYKGTLPSQVVQGKRVTVTTNAEGLRSPEIPIQKPDGTQRILALGDSFTFGLYVEDNETYPAALQKLYQDQGQNVQAINVGYADGWGPDTQYAWLNRKGFDYKPDVVIYGFYLGNDLLDTNPNQWAALDSRGLPTKIVNPNIYVDAQGRIRSRNPDYTTADDNWIYQVPILRDSQLAIYWARMSRAAENADLTGDLIFKAQTPDYLKTREEKFKELVEAMNDVSAQHGAKFVMLMFPFNGQVNPKYLPSGTKIARNYLDDLKPWLDEKHIAYVDLLDEMKAQPGDYFPPTGDIHFTPEGLQFTAAKLKAYFDKQGWIAANPK